MIPPDTEGGFLSSVLVQILPSRPPKGLGVQEVWGWPMSPVSYSGLTWSFTFSCNLLSFSLSFFCSPRPGIEAILAGASRTEEEEEEEELLSGLLRSFFKCCCRLRLFFPL